jgi:ubiquinone/menaquinone biosynthesis C-methylase UbiE
MSTGSSSNENAYIIDAESASEMARLMHQDHLMTERMGGLFPAGIDLSQVHTVLDLACGPGSWVLDVAYEYPAIEIVGTDISNRMIRYAQTRAQTQQLHNASFQVADILQSLDFPANSFDFVNARTLVGFMSPASWPELLRECMRVTRPGGFIRLTELELSLSNSPANEKINALLARAGYISKRTFSPDGRHIGITPMLGRFLRDVGCKDIQHAAHAIDFSAGSEAQEEFFQNMTAGLHLLRPFLLKMQVVTAEEIDSLYQQAIAEIQADDFCAILYFLSVWGRKP